MRKITTLLLVGLAFLYAAEGFAQRGIGTNLPDRSSVLELKSGSRGLLIPRVELTSTTSAAPITTPANSLLVYNTETDGGPVGETLPGVRPGYYFWLRDDVSDPTNPDQATPGQWIPLLNTAGNNIEIDENGVVSVKPGAIGQVLVTVEEDNEVFSKWVDASEILEDLLDINGTNGIEVIPVPAEIDPVSGEVTTPPSFTVKIDGALTENTTITTNAGDSTDPQNPVSSISFSIESSGNQFFIKSLDDVKVGENGKIVLEGDDADTGATGAVFQNTFDVLIVGDGGLVQRVSVEDLLKNAIAVKNGMRYDPTDGFIKLGGELTEETTITLDGNDFIINTDDGADENNVPVVGNLKIEGLKEVNEANKIMVVVDVDPDDSENLNNNNVRTVTRVISHNITENTDIVTGFNDYSPYVHEVNIKVIKLESDINLILPGATAANEGQVINVRLDIEKESPNYLMIKKVTGAEDEDSVTWGALPFQGWTLKVINGAWLVVSSN